MTALELLAPARNADIGIAAVRCGADAVYIAGPAFGARKDAGNPLSEVRRLCDYAHRFGVRVFMTVNISLRDDELEEVHSMMLEARRYGVDAFIIRDERITGWKDLDAPLHASTQCAIRTVERARQLESLGCERIVLERELSLETVRQICGAVKCEVEFFVHGALCVGYSGECRLSEYLNGRSADRGECVQACRSLYDLIDSRGRTLVSNRALLSLKDYNLKSRLEELAGAGVMSFKIEGRLKNASYVKNVTKDYSDALDALCRKYPHKYCRASFGHLHGGFVPDTSKTFNRSYTTLFLDGKRGKWSSMDAPKSMGEAVGTVKNIRTTAGRYTEIEIEPASRNLKLGNGDGFAFSTYDGITGFRADVAKGNTILCKPLSDIKPGITLFRNINNSFEKSLENDMCERLIDINATIAFRKDEIILTGRSEDGREATVRIPSDFPVADNRQRITDMLHTGLEKKTDIYNFHLRDIQSEEGLPLLSASTINALRRSLALEIDKIPLSVPDKRNSNYEADDMTNLPQTDKGDVLLKTKYCIKYELGLCEKHFGTAPEGKLFLLNNSRRLELVFDCRRCEMSVIPAQK